MGFQGGRCPEEQSDHMRLGMVLDSILKHWEILKKHKQLSDMIRFQLQR
jgi:hypothetical protein